MSEIDSGYHAYKSGRDEAIEQCARVADEHAQSSLWANAPLATEASRQIAAAIRALKDKS